MAGRVSADSTCDLANPKSTVATCGTAIAAARALLHDIEKNKREGSPAADADKYRGVAEREIARCESVRLKLATSAAPAGQCPAGFCRL
jgi:hypothetical protein